MTNESFKNLTILYVEDDPYINETTEAILRIFEYNVITAQNGEEGYEKFCLYKKDINLIITDIQMPIMNGLEMLEKIKKLDAFVPMIITTAYQDISFLRQSIDLAVNSYITKPINLEKLKSSIIKAIEPIKLKEQLINKNNELECQIKENAKKHKLIISQSKFASMGEMINIIVHQWRQPLSSIGTSVFNLKLKIIGKYFDLSSSQGREDFEEFFIIKFNEIESYIQNLTNTIDDFRNFYKKDKIKGLYLVTELIEESLKFLSYLHESYNINIIQNIQTNTKIEIYKNEFLHVINNIIKNSFDSFLENPCKDMQIRINAYEDKDNLYIEILNNGQKIPSSSITKIFDPYFSTKEEKNGTGLGLYISKIIIEKHHQGKINVKNIDNGVCFTITLPK